MDSVNYIAEIPREQPVELSHDELWGGHGEPGDHCEGADCAHCGGGVPARPNGAAKEKPKPGRKAKSQEAVSGSDTPVMVRLCLTEAQCDSLYRICTPQQKAIAIAAALQAHIGAA